MNSKKYSIWFLTVSLVIIVLLAGAYQLSYYVCGRPSKRGDRI